MDEKVKHILEKVSELYIAKGIKNVTMDDVAENLGMSKKTLYQYFSDKATLIEQVLYYYMNIHNQDFSMLCKDETNAIDKLYAVSKIISKMLGSVPVVVLDDLHKYYPEILHKYLTMKRDHILSQIKKNLKDGIEQGLYRENLDIDIASKSYLALSETMIDTTYYPTEKYVSVSVLNELFMYHIRGIASDKGMKYINHYNKK